MPGRQAKLLSQLNVRLALSAIDRQADPPRGRAMLLLSLRAGLRAAEIAGLDWDMVLEPNGRGGNLLNLPDRIAKNGSGRRIPLHSEARAAILVLARRGPRRGPLIASTRGGALRPNSVVNWFVALYAEIGADGCSSHSGRRTFITRAARNAHKAGASLWDVQLLAGHRSILTTQGYIDGDTDAQRRLVHGL